MIEKNKQVLFDFFVDSRNFLEFGDVFFTTEIRKIREIPDEKSLFSNKAHTTPF